MHSIYVFIENIFFTGISLIKVLIFSKYNAQIPIFNGNDHIFAIANGPSFKDDYLSHKRIFLDSDCIVANNFALSEYFFEIKPKFYVFFDAFMWASKGENEKRTLEILKNNVHWKMFLFLPNYAKKDIVNLELEQNTNLKIIYYNYNFFRGFHQVGHWLMKKNLASVRSSTVTAISIFLSVNMGFKRIFLTGADQRWHENVDVDEKNILYTKVVHFYDQKEKIEWVPFYKEGKKEKGLNTVSDFFNIQYKTFKSYEDIAEYANYRKVKIINTGLKSFVDSFEKISISEINI